MSDLFVFVNDALVPAGEASLLVSDLAIQRGYGIFDFLKTIDGRPIFPDEHLTRFFHSARQLRLPLNLSKEELLVRIQQLIEKNNIPNAGIKLILTGGYSADGYTISAPNLIIMQTPLSPPAAASFEKGIRLVSYPHIRQMPEVKSIDYLMAVWLQPFIKEQGADDVLYQRDGLVSECPRSNFFIVTADDTVVTASENILKGVIRGKVLELAGENFNIAERPVRLHELRDASEAFITSTTKHVLPVLKVDGQVIGDGKPGKISRWLNVELAKLVSKTIALLILIAGFQACKTAKKNFETGINASVDRMIVVPTSVARFTVDVSKKIYLNDSLKDGTPVVIDTFNIKFYNQKDSVQIQMNNISFYFVRDSVHYEHLILPKWDVIKYADTMRAIFDCSYRIPGKDPIQCLSGEYSIINREVKKIGEFKPCVR